MQTDPLVDGINQVGELFRGYIEIMERLDSIEKNQHHQERKLDLVTAQNDDTKQKLESIIEVFGGLEKMMDQLKTEGMSGLLKMMRGK
jgi:hypothetical protein